MSKDQTRLPFQRARATEARRLSHIAQAVKKTGLTDEQYARVMECYEELADESMQPASSADLYRFDERPAPKYAPLG